MPFSSSIAWAILRGKIFRSLIFKNRFKHLKRNYFGFFRQRQSCLQEIKSPCKNFQRFIFKHLKPVCFSSEQDFVNKSK